MAGSGTKWTIVDNSRWIFTNGAERPTREQAEAILTSLRFFEMEGSREKFDRGAIKIYTEKHAMEACVILDTEADEMVFVDWRGVVPVRKTR